MSSLKFGEREAEAITVLWRRRGGTVAEVRDDLGGRLAYTTVLTILRNLQRKGLVRRERKGRADTYCPIVTEHVVRTAALRTMIATWFGGSGPAMLEHALLTGIIRKNEAIRIVRGRKLPRPLAAKRRRPSSRAAVAMIRSADGKRRTKVGEDMKT